MQHPFVAYTDSFSWSGCVVMSIFKTSQTPNSGKTWGLTLLSRGKKNNKNKKNNFTQILPEVTVLLLPKE